VLEHIALNQERFKAPGLRADSRGIAIGERGLLRFGTLTQVVGFFRALTDEQSLDSLLPTLRIIKARSRIQGIELLVDLPAQGSHMLDRAAAIARLLRGEVYTGRAPHFVNYRDTQAPFGYDVQRLVQLRDGICLYTPTGPMPFSEDGEISFRGLLLSLSLVRRRATQDKGTVFIRVPPGLRNATQRFLWNREIHGGVAELRRQASGRFDEGETFYLFKVENLPARLLPLFEGLPGVELYHTRRSNVFVQRGFAHPFALESCRKALDDDGLYFFSGHRDACDQVVGEPVFVDIDNLKAVELEDDALRPDLEAVVIGQGGRKPVGWTSDQVAEALHYPVHLMHRPGLQAGVVGLFIQSATEMAWLKRIIYALPQTALEDYRMAVTDQGCLVVNRLGVELIPIGMQLREIFNGVFIPANTQFSPPIGYDQLQRHLKLKPNHLYFLPAGLQQAFAVPEGLFRPVANYLLADAEFVAVTDRAPTERMELAEAVEMVNRDIGYFALWGHNLRGVDLDVDGSKPTQPMAALPPGEPSSEG